MKKLKNLKKTEKIITEYTLINNFTVEVERDGDVTDFYMCKTGYGVKMYMFGIPNCPVTFEEALILANAEDYMRFFADEYANN